MDTPTFWGEFLQGLVGLIIYFFVEILTLGFFSGIGGFQNT